MLAAAHILRKSEGPIPVPAMIDRLSGIDPAGIQSAGGWRVARTFHHLAQGVEFSLSGYPDLKHPLFRATVGRLAFHVFQARGQMRHATDQAIPGEAVTEGDPAQARDRLIAALEAFRETDALHPHFAYGALSKAQYERAHVMHIADHIDGYTV